MTFIITFGGWAKPRIMRTKGVYLRVVLGFFSFWWMNQDLEMWLDTIELKDSK